MTLENWSVDQLMANTCFGCRHCQISKETADYSSWTPGEPAQFECWRGHWDALKEDHPTYSIQNRTVAENLLKRKGCPHFEEDT